MIHKSFIKYVLFYILLTYVVQFMFYYFGFYNKIWRTSEDYFFLFLQLSVLFVLSLIFYYANPITILFEILYFLTKYIAKIAIKYKSIIIYFCLILSIYFLFNNLNSYRYSSQRLSYSLDWLLLFFIFVKSLVYAYVFIDFDLKFNEINNKYLSLYQKVAIIILQLFSITGLTSGLMLLFSIYLLFAFNRSKKNYNFFFSFLKFILVFLLFIILFVISYAVKWNVDFQVAINTIIKIDLKSYFDYLVSRLSNSYYALMNYTNLNLNYIEYSNNLFITPKNLIFRLDSLIGGILNVAKPEFNSLNRLNYTLINNLGIDDKSGTSPGIIASFLYQFGSFLGLFFASSYVSYIFKLSDSSYKFSFLKLFVLFIFFQGVFKAPIQALLIFDNNFLSLVIFIYYNKTVSLNYMYYSDSFDNSPLEFIRKF